MFVSSTSCHPPRFKARPSDGRHAAVEQHIPCINGLSAWFTICSIHEPSEEEVGYSEGMIGDADERAEMICAALIKVYG